MSSETLVYIAPSRCSVSLGQSSKKMVRKKIKQRGESKLPLAELLLCVCAVFHSAPN